MKKDWTYKKLGKVCDVLNGYAFKSDKYVDKGIRVIRIANVQKGVIVDDQPAFYPLATQSEIDRYLLNEGDILMSLTGNVGRVGILQKEMLPAALNQRVACLRMINNALHSKFFFHYLNSDLFEQKCIASARGIAQLNMSTEWLKEQLIPIPPLSIQRSIVSELDLLHSVIEKKQEQLRALDNLAQSLFYQMFGDPITNPMGWEIKKLGEVAPVKPYQKEIQSENGLFWLLNLDMVESQTGKIIEKNMVTKKEIGNSTTSFSPDNVLYSKLRPYLNKVVLPNNYGYCTTELLPLFPMSGILTKEYLCYLLRSNTFVEYINIKVAGAKMPRVTMNDFRKFPLPLPPLSLQQSFAAKVSAIEAQKQAITQSIKDVESLLAQRMDHYFG